MRKMIIGKTKKMIKNIIRIQAAILATDTKVFASISKYKNENNNHFSFD
jgi:hypothetical protein